MQLHRRSLLEFYESRLPLPQELVDFYWKTDMTDEDFVRLLYIAFRYGGPPLNTWQSKFLMDRYEDFIAPLDNCKWCGHLKGLWCDKALMDYAGDNFGSTAIVMACPEDFGYISFNSLASFQNYRRAS